MSGANRPVCEVVASCGEVTLVLTGIPGGRSGAASGRTAIRVYRWEIS